MTKMGTFSPEETLIGGYDFEEREIQTKEKLTRCLANIIKENIHLDVITQFYKNPESTTKKKKSADEDDLSVNETSLEGLERNIEKLKKRVDEYSDPDFHFTKQYRTLIGFCGKYQTDLDKVDVKGNEELRLRRKGCLKKLDKLVDLLATKVHPDGLICNKCEIKE